MTLWAPKPARPWKTVAPANPSLRRRSSSAVASGWWCHMSLSPMKMRTSDCSPSMTLIGAPFRIR